MSLKFQKTTYSVTLEDLALGNGETNGEAGGDGTGGEAGGEVEILMKKPEVALVVTPIMEMRTIGKQFVNVNG